MVLDVRTPLRHSIIGLGLAMVMAVAGCSKEPTRAIREVRAQAPQTELTYAPLEFDTTNFRVHLYWNAYDNDGEVTRFGAEESLVHGRIPRRRSQWREVLLGGCR